MLCLEDLDTLSTVQLENMTTWVEKHVAEMAELAITEVSLLLCQSVACNVLKAHSGCQHTHTQCFIFLADIAA